MDAVLNAMTTGKEPDLGSYKDYVIAKPEYTQFSNQMIQVLEIEPSVAAYALFSVDFRSIMAAMDFIYEREENNEGELKRMHPFVGCLRKPKPEKFKISGVNENDIE